jgi:hypothetical protein
LSLGDDLSTLKSATAENCSKRGDSFKSIEKRTNSIEMEAAAWRTILELGGSEFPKWPFPEHIYREDELGTRLAARARLIDGNPVLEDFLKPEAEIRALKSATA